MRAAILFVLLVLVATSPAAAWPLIDVTASEVLSVDPPRARTTFTVVEQGSTPPGWCPWAWFHVTAQDPQAADAVSFFECQAPAEGQCRIEEYESVQFASFDPFHGNAGTLPPDTYSIVTDGVAPCVRFDFFCITLMGGVPSIETCLLVDMPVPARASTWGRLKTRYR